MKKRDLDALIQKWATSGAITSEQAVFMRDEVATFTSERSGDTFIKAIMYIGATALSLGCLLLVASNWEHLTKTMKLVLTLLMPVVPLAYAYWQLVLKSDGSVLGRAASILGLALIGGSIAMIGQIYNLEANFESFIWTWTLLAAPFALLFHRVEHLLALTCMLGMSGLTSLVIYLDRFDIPDSTGILIVTLALLGYSLLVYCLGSAFRHFEAWYERVRALRILAMVSISITLFITTFEFYAREVANVGYSESGWEVFSVVFNVFFVAFLVFALLRATKHEEYSLAFSVVRFFGIYLLTKYFTLFFDQMDTGLFFVIGGVLFILGGWQLEKRKQAFVAYMKAGHDKSAYGNL